MAVDTVRLDDLPDDADFCVTCGKTLPFDHRYGLRKYCSIPCKTAHYTDLDSQARRDANAGRQCEQCGLPLTRGRTAQARFCSPVCHRKAGYRKRYPMTCKQCGKECLAYHTNSQFCGSECATASRVLPRRPCAWCGQPINHTQKRVKCCSPTCGARYRVSQQTTGLE